MYRQDVPADSGLVGFEDLTPNTTVLGPPSEPVSFPDGAFVQPCGAIYDCLRAWSGEQVIISPLSGAPNRDPLVIEFTSPQSSVGAHVNGLYQDGTDLATLTATAYRADDSVVDTDVLSFVSAPAWGSRFKLAQGPGTAEITRVVLTPHFPSDAVIVDDLLYDDETILPVELASFSGVLDGSLVRFKWTTYAEANVAGFRIERELQGEWSGISELVSARYPNGGAYEWSGFDPSVGSMNAGQQISRERSASGSMRLRLASVDRDGSIGYSRVVELRRPITGRFELSEV
ncbi:MAG: hypothetical protein KDD65_14805 [Bacteroidetes bacterium]|nr:hypothetical protein [Bacteroidota bacterium]